MKCCQGNDNSNEQKGKVKGFLSYLLMMVLCCGAPIILVMLLPLLTKVSPGASTSLSKITPYLCPILMLAMIPMMLFNHRGRNNENTCCDQKQVEEKASDK